MKLTILPCYLTWISIVVSYTVIMLKEQGLSIIVSDMWFDCFWRDV
jgi:hypothetical protein